MSRIFISYSQKDREFVNRLASDLAKLGMNVSYDLLIKPGASWAETVTKAIEGSQYILVVMSPEYFESGWARQELQVAMLRETENKALVIPLMSKTCVPTSFLANKPYADFTVNYDKGFQGLLDAIQKGPNRERQTSGTSINKQHLQQAVDLFKAPASEKITLMARDNTKSSGRCFIVMPFNKEDLNVVYEDSIRPVVEDQCNLVCKRGDDVFGSNVIMDDIITSIRQSDLVIADLTGKNANVFYEVGICHTLSKPVLLLSQTIDDVPFDLRHRRVLIYEYSPRGSKLFEAKLKENIFGILKAKDS